MVEGDKNFYLGSGSIEFNDRQKSVFQELDRLESQKPKNRYTKEELNHRSKKLSVGDGSRSSLKLFRGKESIFKRPEGEPKKKSTKLKIPDFVKNPHKWTKYRLEDDGISDKSNRAVAMAFLEEMRKRNSQMETESAEPKQITFNRSVNKKEGERLAGKVDSEEKASFVNGKFVMPEYVVGQKIKKDRPKRQKTIPTEEKTPRQAVVLQHLIDDVNEE